MIDIKKDLRAYSELSPEDLDTECHGLKYIQNKEDVLEFQATDPEAWIDFLDSVWALDRFILGPGVGKGVYPDGTVLQFIKSRRCWEFKKAKKVFAEVYIA